MNSDKYLSVVVPVYNVESYLHRCIDSIINQTFTALEIILVNDGSSDRSPQICDEYAKKDVRVKVIHQQNAGVSVARNSGIIAAVGEYITFVDSDDWLESTMYEKMCKITTSGTTSDVVMCDFTNIKKNSQDGISANIRKGFYSKSQIITELYPTLLVREDFGRIPIISVWACLFKRSMLVENNICFDCLLKYSEDYLFMADVMVNANSFYYLKGYYFYNYLQYEESRSKKFKADWWRNLVYLNKKLGDVLNDNLDYDFTRQIKLQLLHSILVVLNGIYHDPEMTQQHKIIAVRNILHQTQLKSVFSNLSVKQQKYTLKIMLYIIKYKMTLNYFFFQRFIEVIKWVKF